MNPFRIEMESFLFHYPNISTDLANKIALFLIKEGKGKSIQELYNGYVGRQKIGLRSSLTKQLPDQKIWKEKKFLTGERQRKMIEQLLDGMDIVDDGHKINWYQFPYYDGNNFSSGVILNQPFELRYSLPNHRALFRRLFAEIFSMTTSPDELLIFHFHSSFHGNKKEYRRFLFTIEKEYYELIKSGFNLWNDVLQELLHSRQPGNRQVHIPKKLADLFLNESDLDRCVAALRSVDPPVISEQNRYLLGPKSKQALVAWIEVLKYRNLIMDQNDLQIAKMLSEFFQMDINERTIRATKTNAHKTYYLQLMSLIK